MLKWKIPQLFCLIPIDAHFKGNIAAEAKQRGKNIAGLMLHKIESYAN